MLKLVIEGYNAQPVAAWNTSALKNGIADCLAVRVYPTDALTGGASIQYCETAWEPTPGEMTAILNGGSVILRVAGWQVPASVYVREKAPLSMSPAPIWILRYAGSDHDDEVFSGLGAEQAAVSRFEVQRMAWTCHLFREVARG